MSLELLDTLYNADISVGATYPGQFSKLTANGRYKYKHVFSANEIALSHPGRNAEQNYVQK